MKSCFDEGLTRIAEGSTENLISLDLWQIPKTKSHAYILTMNDGKENRWNLPFTRAFRKAIACVNNDTRGVALITRSTLGKFFSNGLDLPFLQANPDQSTVLAFEVMNTFADVLELPIPTICLLQGHGFGAGFMIALSHDYRVQMSGKGFMCANEIELGMGIPEPELLLFGHAMSNQDFFETVLNAKRWDGKLAFEKGITHVTGNTLQELEEGLIKLTGNVGRLGANRKAYGRLKKQVKGHVSHALRTYKNEKFSLL